MSNAPSPCSTARLEGNNHATVVWKPSLACLLPVHSTERSLPQCGKPPLVVRSQKTCSRLCGNPRLPAQLHETEANFAILWKTPIACSAARFKRASAPRCGDPPLPRERHLHTGREDATLHTSYVMLVIFSVSCFFLRPFGGGNPRLWCGRGGIRVLRGPRGPCRQVAVCPGLIWRA